MKSALKATQNPAPLQLLAAWTAHLHMDSFPGSMAFRALWSSSHLWLGIKVTHFPRGLGKKGRKVPQAGDWLLDGHHNSQSTSMFRWLRQPCISPMTSLMHHLNHKARQFTWKTKMYLHFSSSEASKQSTFWSHIWFLATHFKRSLQGWESWGHLNSSTQ